MPPELFTIKPLEWEWLEPTRFSSEGYWAVETLCGVRYLVTCNLKGTFWWQSSISEPIPCASPEEGKLLAELHWQSYVKQALEPVGSCLWKYDPDGYWKTGCGQGFTLSNEESLDANAMRFCHACGKRIEQALVQVK